MAEASVDPVGVLAAVGEKDLDRPTPCASWTRLVAAFDSPGVLDKLLKMPIGAVPGSVVIWIASSDIFTHGWDLAKAIDQSTDLDPELAQMILQRMYVTLPDSMRGTDGNAPFGPKVDVPSSAPAADRLAGYLGRTP